MIDWDEKKSKANKIKHGFSFDEIIGVFDDPNILYLYDSAHSEKEDRYKCLGRLGSLSIFLVIIAEKFQDLRIISARRATTFEEGVYYGNIKETT